jgi:LmbE family N-acetylglucosaminyl deacetylase
MLAQRRTVLVLAPHTDDGEFGCGATIARLVEEGSDLHYVAFSDCRESLPAGWAPDTLVREVTAATRVLGIAETNLRVHSFPVRNFFHHRQAILELLVQLQRELDPDLVFLPSSNDLHQDHLVVAQEGLRAFKRTTLLAYEIPWNNLQFHNEMFILLEERHVRKKVDALGCYESQKSRSYATEENIRAQVTLRGCQIGARYAEVFEVVRAVMR